MIRLFKLMFSLALLLVLLVVADRLAARVAGQVVADQIKSSQHLATTPRVTVRGFPFLTQLFNGTYDDVDASARNIARNNVRATSLTLHLHGVHLKAADVLSQSVQQIPVDRADGTVLLSYADIDALARPEGLQVAAGPGGRLAVSGSVTVAGISLAGSGTGSVAVVPQGLEITVSDVKAAGLPAALSSLLATKLSFVIPSSSLPYGVTVRSVRTDQTGVTLIASSGPFRIPLQ